MFIYKAAVVGGGAMGAEIAQVISYSGLPVVLKEINEPLAQKSAGEYTAYLSGARG